MNLNHKIYLTSFPDLIREWHPTLNSRPAEEFTHGSKFNAWWICAEGHVFETAIFSRASKRKTGCPYCSGAKINETNNLAARFPHLIAEWHPTKNGKLLPHDVMPGSIEKAWWKCPKGHSYQSEIKKRATQKKPSNCPFCMRTRASRDCNLVKSFPQLVKKEWDFTKNLGLNPKDFLSGSNKLVWWKCVKGHSYQTQIRRRTYKNNPSGCPYCAGVKVNSDNNLAALFPKVAAEWHPIKNGKVLPSHITAGSSMNAWWQCAHGHEYQSAVKGRTRAERLSGCPHCNPQSSRAERRLYFELKSIFPDIKARDKIDGYEVDILLPGLGVALEYDGSYYHKDKIAYDRRKNRAVARQGVKLIRVREAPLVKIGRDDIRIPKEDALAKRHIDLVLAKLTPYVKTQKLREKIKRYLKASEFLNDYEYIKFQSNHIFPKVPLAISHPEVCVNWHPTKNGKLSPDNFTHGSRYLIWWQCKKGHSFQARIKDRVDLRTAGYCPVCSEKAR